MSSALTFFLAHTLSRLVSASVHSRVTCPLPSFLRPQPELDQTAYGFGLLARKAAETIVNFLGRQPSRISPQRRLFLIERDTDPTRLSPHNATMMIAVLCVDNQVE